MTTSPDLDLAREWAQLVGPGAASNIGRAAAEVITALPDEWIDADKLREVIERWRSEPLTSETAPFMVEQLHTLLPAPTPRTLADMTREERRTCQWMQARDDVGNRIIITKLNEEDQEGAVLYENGGQYEWPYSIIVPLPDLPRMVWPDAQTAEETPDPPRPEDVPEGEAWIVTYLGDEWVGTRASHDEVWALARMDGEVCHYADGCHVTLVSRLVPEEEA